MKDTNHIAENFDGFVEKVSEAIRKTLNSDRGQDLTEQLLRMKLAANPDMTPEEWKETKSQFMTFIFALFVQNCPEALEELGNHVYNELRKEETA